MGSITAAQSNQLRFMVDQTIYNVCVSHVELTHHPHYELTCVSSVAVVPMVANGLDLIGDMRRLSDIIYCFRNPYITCSSFVDNLLNSY